MAQQKIQKTEEITAHNAHPEFGLDRRNFIKGSMALGIGVLLTPLSGREAAAAPSQAGTGKMRDLQSYVQTLEKQGLLARVRTEVDLVHELAGVAKHFEGKEVVLFEKVRGYDMPVLIGLMWSRKNVGALLGVSAEKLPFHIGDAIGKWRSNPSDPAVQPVIISDAPAQELRITPVDVTRLPTPVLALDDGGHYLANSVVIAKDPDTG
ncbi:MAG: UbiD family decarboxylase, partial [Syntrophobacterales bacterium]|nr:UbiD family decarboxylase [Syntrophobacterales bacterium]